MASDWSILGAGAIGCLFASALHRAGYSTTLLVKPGDAEGPGNNRQRSVSIEAQQSAEEIVLPLSTASDTNYISHLLVTTKAYDVRAALASIAHRLDEHSQILLLVNGMGIIEELESDYPHFTIYSGTTTEGAYRKATTTIVHAGSGITTFGSNTDEQPPLWFEDLSRLSLLCTWDNNIADALWRKLAVNCAINPLTALLRCTNGTLLSRRDYAQRLALLCDEIAGICAAAGHTGIAAGLHAQVTEVITQTGDNRSSMLQDVLAGRRTEVEYITGYLVSIARGLGVPAPLNEDLLRTVERGVS